MEIIEGNFGKPKDDEVAMGEHLLESIALNGIDKVDSGCYCLIVETDEGLRMIAGSQPTFYTLTMLDRVKLGVLLGGATYDGEGQ